jgi:hypothetical protein
MQAIATQVQRVNESVLKAARVAEEHQRRLATWFEANEVMIGSVLASVARASEEIRRAFPANWQGLNAEELGGALALVEAGQMSVVWVPREDIMRELIACPDFAEQRRVMSRRRAEILEDACAVLEDCTHHRFAGQSAIEAFALEAVRTAKAGELDLAAQAVTASGLGTVIHDALGHARLGEAFKAMSQADHEEASLSEMRVVGLRLATANALVDVTRHPVGFNRHGTQHGTIEYFSEPEMLAGVMLLCAWARELSWWAEREGS